MNRCCRNFAIQAVTNTSLLVRHRTRSNMWRIRLQDSVLGTASKYCSSRDFPRTPVLTGLPPGTVSGGILCGCKTKPCVVISTIFFLRGGNTAHVHATASRSLRISVSMISGKVFYGEAALALPRITVGTIEPSVLFSQENRSHRTHLDTLPSPRRFRR